MQTPLKQMDYWISICEAGVSAFSKGGNEGALYAALLVNGVQWIATVITVICVDKACLHSSPLCGCQDELCSYHDHKNMQETFLHNACHT